MVNKFGTNICRHTAFYYFKVSFRMKFQDSQRALTLFMVPSLPCTPCVLSEVTGPHCRALTSHLL